VRSATFSVTGVRKINVSSLKVARPYPLVLLVGGLEARWSVRKRRSLGDGKRNVGVCNRGKKSDISVEFCLCAAAR
jgi:hypothetical protein